jgi:class 3 adenylate cyclase
MQQGFDEQGFSEVRAIARRRRIRILLPVAVVVLMLAALIGIVVFEYKTMRADALALSKGVIVNLQSRIETEVNAYLAPIPGIISLSRDLLTDSLAEGVEEQLAEALGIGMLRNAPQLTALFVGIPEGGFLMVRRGPRDAKHALETKIIRQDPEAESTYRNEMVYRDAAGEEISREQLPWDGYDARTRPWFIGATQSQALHWTSVYPFFTDRSAGITASLPVADEQNALRAVIGADVTLESLSRFLGTLTIGRTGMAMIVNGEGELIAHADTSLLRSGDDGKVRLAAVSDLEDPVVNRAFDRFRVEGHGRRDFDLDGRRYISSVSSLSHLLQRDWSVLVVVPEDDFVGFVVDNVTRTLLMGLGVIALAALLAALLIRQGLRADRDAVRILGREAQLDAEAEAFGRVAAMPALLSESGQANQLGPLTETIAHAARTRRVAIWRIDEALQQLVCVDCYDRDSEGHTQGMHLSREQHPLLFTTFADGEGIRATDVGDDPRLSSLLHHYLAPLGCTALLAAPIVGSGELLGVLWLEDGGQRADWPDHSQSFVRAVSNLLAIRFSGTPGPAALRPAVAPCGGLTAPAPNDRQFDLDTTLGSRRAAVFAARLARKANESGAGGALVIDALGVMALRLTDALVLAEPTSDDSDDCIVSTLLEQVKASARTHSIAYLKFFSDQVIAAVDPQSAGTDGLERLLDYAADVRLSCEQLFAQHHAPLAFRLGIDIGPAIGSTLGSDRHAFAFWGDAVQTAIRMADTSPPGAIQVTESVYQPLKGRYLFQLRGHHYTEGLGEFSTYLLSGRL